MNSDCTGLSAAWCPIHGDCICDRAVNMDNPECPLHGDDSRHPDRPREAIARPKVVCLCGSSRFVAEMACIAWVLERDEGYVVLALHLLPASYPGVASDHQAEAEGKKDHFDELHLRKIDLADEVLVVNIGGYIGESTRREIAYALSLGKPLRYLEKP